MRRLLLLLPVALAGCGSATPVHDQRDVERAFADAGIELRRLPSRGAEQPAMGETSACGVRFAAATEGGTVAVSVCDDADAARAAARDTSYTVVRDNVAVEYGGESRETRRRIERAVERLD